MTFFAKQVVAHELDDTAKHTIITRSETYQWKAAAHYPLTLTCHSFQTCGVCQQHLSTLVVGHYHNRDRWLTAGWPHQFRHWGRPDDLVQLPEEPRQTHIPGDAILLLHQQVDLVSLLHLMMRAYMEKSGTIHTTPLNAQLNMLCMLSVPHKRYVHAACDPHQSLLWLLHTPIIIKA